MIKNILKAALFLLAGTTFIYSCNENPNGVYNSDIEPRLYMPQARENPIVIAVNDTSETTFTYGANYGGPDEPSEDVQLTFEVRPAMVDSFNVANGTPYTMLPAEAYTLSQTEAVIKAGEIETAPLQLTINKDVELEKSRYLLPITLEALNSNIAINTNLKTTYFLVQFENNNQVLLNGTDVVITGFMVNPSGADSPEAGETRDYTDEANGAAFTLEAGYEYIQLMALRDIDFSQTPYSVVVGRKYTPHARGWASGDTKSFKFNLTQGQAAKGTFFYVGGEGKRIDGYASEGLSTDISDANWIRSIPINLGDGDKTAGDGFGKSSSGLLTNTSTGTGLSVFKGTSVTPNAAPIDAVFYGSEVGTALNNEGATVNGYLVPELSDLYSAHDPLTGEEQLLFGQGSNTFMVNDAKDGNFIQMGGQFSTEKVLEPRKKPLIIDTKRTSTLELIETGVGATTFIDE